MNIEEEFLTTEETAKALRVTSVTLWRWRKSGHIRGIKVGGKLIFAKSEIMRVIECNTEPEKF
jgi:excisionase family DNA binding protein